MQTAIYSIKRTFYTVVAFHCAWCLLLPYISALKGAKVVKTHAWSQILKNMVSRCWPSSDGSIRRMAVAQKRRSKATQFRLVFPHFNPSTSQSKFGPCLFRHVTNRTRRLKLQDFGYDAVLFQFQRFHQICILMGRPTKFQAALPTAMVGCCGAQLGMTFESRELLTSDTRNGDI